MITGKRKGDLVKTQSGNIETVAQLHFVRDEITNIITSVFYETERGVYQSDELEEPTSTDVFQYSERVWSAK